MRFAFKTSPQNTNWHDMLEVWRAADDIELFESGWVFDHFYPIYSDSTGPCLEGWVTLTALAQATGRLRLGTLVTGDWNFLGGSAEEFAHKRDVLREHCAELGRDPEEILLSSHVRFGGDPGATVAEVAALADAGAGLSIIYLRPPLTPTVLEPLARALSTLS